MADEDCFAGRQLTDAVCIVVLVAFSVALCLYSQPWMFLAGVTFLDCAIAEDKMMTEGEPLDKTACPIGVAWPLFIVPV